MLEGGAVRQLVRRTPGVWEFLWYGRHLLAHAQHTVDLGDSEPVEDVRHKGLEAHVFDAGDHFGPFEVVRCTIFASFPRVVNNWTMLGMTDDITICMEGY